MPAFFFEILQLNKSNINPTWLRKHSYSTNLTVIFNCTWNKQVPNQTIQINSKWLNKQLNNPDTKPLENHPHWLNYLPTRCGASLPETWDKQAARCPRSEMPTSMLSGKFVILKQYMYILRIQCIHMQTQNKRCNKYMQYEQWYIIFINDKWCISFNKWSTVQRNMHNEPMPEIQYCANVVRELLYQPRRSMTLKTSISNGHPEFRTLQCICTNEKEHKTYQSHTVYETPR